MPNCQTHKRNNVISVQISWKIHSNSSTAHAPFAGLASLIISGIFEIVPINRSFYVPMVVVINQSTWMMLGYWSQKNNSRRSATSKFQNSSKGKKANFFNANTAKTFFHKMKSNKQEKSIAISAVKFNA